MFPNVPSCPHDGSQQPSVVNPSSLPEFQGHQTRRKIQEASPVGQQQQHLGTQDSGNDDHQSQVPSALAGDPLSFRQTHRNCNGHQVSHGQEKSIGMKSNGAQFENSWIHTASEPVLWPLLVLTILLMRLALARCSTSLNGRSIPDVPTGRLRRSFLLSLDAPVQ